VVSIDSYRYSDGVLDIFFLVSKGHHLGFGKKHLSLLEPKLLVMWERNGKALKMVYSAYQFFGKT
jgi:hypothetical protein